MRYYEDLREYIKVLEDSNKLCRIKSKINKDTELHPLVRWQFQGRLPEEELKAFLFENVVDVKGRTYTTPVLVAAHAASRQIYALAMKCQPEEITTRWEQAQLSPIEPEIIQNGAVQEEVHMGDNLLEHGGLEEFPIPIATPGFDNAPYFTAGNWITKDPETSISNVGVHRAMVKSKTRIGCLISTPVQHIGLHRQKYRKAGIPVMPAAVVIGPTPNVLLVACIRVPYGTNELAIAGGIAGEPLQLVKCKTVDIEVPARAEIVIEGEIPTDFLEKDGPFGEHTGYMGMGWPTAYMNITCITHRKKPIWDAFQSLFPPSESSLLRTIGMGASYHKFLKHDCGIPSLLDVVFHENSGAAQFCVIRLENCPQADVWKALNAVAYFEPGHAKITVAVDEDIDPRDPDSIIWALCYRMQPDHDILILPGKMPLLDPSVAPREGAKGYGGHTTNYSVVINATRKWDYPPTALPGKEFMERARKIWEKEGLPPLNPKIPWHGVLLGYWPKEYKEAAELALKGEHYKTGEKLAQGRIEG